jgi:hypothetical protein
MFSLDYYNGSKWEHVDLQSIMWTFIAYFLKPGTTVEKNMSLYNFVVEYNNSKKGKYRIIKDFNDIEDFNESHPHMYYVYAEFVIN